VRHRRSVSDYQLGGARGRRWTELRRDVRRGGHHLGKTVQVL
jgi:hypothetical protein